MVQVPKPNRISEEIERIRDVVKDHTLPEFVAGFDVQLGEYDGDPAMWIVFRTRDIAGLSSEELIKRAEALSAIRKEVHSDLIEKFDARYPYFRFQTDRTGPLVRN